MVHDAHFSLGMQYEQKETNKNISKRMSNIHVLYGSLNICVGLEISRTTLPVTFCPALNTASSLSKRMSNSSIFILVACFDYYMVYSVKIYINFINKTSKSVEKLLAFAASEHDPINSKIENG